MERSLILCGTLKEDIFISGFVINVGEDVILTISKCKSVLSKVKITISGCHFYVSYNQLFKLFNLTSIIYNNE